MSSSESGIECLNFIGGQFVPSSGTATISVMNPATGEALATVPQSSADDVAEAVDSAQRAFPRWRLTTPQERASALLRLADIIDEHAQEFIELEMLNVGKPRMVAAEEIPVCSDSLRFLAGAARTLTTTAAGEYLRGHTSMMRREPLGVVAAIAPWNYPLMMAIWKIAPALATGNTVVLKPAEQTPLSVMRLMALAREIFPPGVINVVTGDGDSVGDGLSVHPDVAMVSLTGSVQTGRRVSARAAATLKHVHLELGGKAPVVVFEDANLHAVARAIRTFGYWNTGQECGSATRVLVERHAYDELVDLVVRDVAQIRTGDPADGDDIEMGPLISAQQQARVLAFTTRATEAGAELLIGGAKLERPGFFVSPSVIVGADQNSEIIQSEVFGPVVTLQPFDDEDEALAKSNDSDYGLCASVWTRNGPRSLRFARDLDFGTVWINAHLALVSEGPWGGFGQSGHGKDMSSCVLESHTRVKHVMANLES